jgi:hypothetical protein
VAATVIVVVAILVVIIVDKTSLLLLLLVAVKWMARVLLLLMMMKLRRGRLRLPHHPSFFLMKSVPQHQVADAVPAPKRIVACGCRGGQGCTGSRGGGRRRFRFGSLKPHRRGEVRGKLAAEALLLVDGRSPSHLARPALLAQQSAAGAGQVTQLRHFGVTLVTGTLGMVERGRRSRGRSIRTATAACRSTIG